MHDASPAQAELQLGHAVRLAEADAGDRYGARAVPLRDDLVSTGTRRLLYFLSAMVVLVWVIACANVGGVLLARNSGRASEFAVRAALGASRRRVASQLLSESLVLAVPAAATGFLVAHMLIQVLTAYAPESLAREGTVRMDTAGAAAAMCLALGSALLIGLLTAIQWPGGRRQLHLEETLSHSSLSKRVSRAQDLLVIAEVALGIVVLVCATLAVRSLRNLDRVEMGFAAQSVLTLNIRMPDAYKSAAHKQTLFDTLRGRLGGIGGMQHLTAGSLPVPDAGIRTSITIEGGRRLLNGNAKDFPFTPGLHFVGADYFQTLGVPIRRGRDFNRAEVFAGAHVVIINEQMARMHWADQDPIGKRVTFGARRRGIYDEPWATVVGVVADVRYGGPEIAFKPEIYRPLQAYHAELVLLLKSDPATVVHANDVRQIIHAVDPNIPVFNVNTMEHYVRQVTAEARYRSRILSGFGLLVAVLTACGLYAIVAGRVASRRRELAIRAALGSKPGALVALMLRHAAVLLFPAALAGLVLAAFSTRALASQLFEVSTLDGLSFALSALALLSVGFAAAYIPARQAAHIDPMAVLRDA